jgi:hypothetical protein
MRLRTIQLINECGSDLAGTSYHPAVTVYRLPVYLLCGYLTSWLKGLPHLDYLESSQATCAARSARGAFSDLRAFL